MKNILSVDMESWVHFYNDALKIENEISSAKRKKMDDGYIRLATRDLLGLLAKYDQKATFFVLGELYEWYPEMIEEIEKKGHEIAYHTHRHVVLKNGRILEEELEKSADFIRRFRPIGFRAPKIFITRDSFPRLKKLDFKYSSSTYDEHRIERIEGIDEIPVSTFSLIKSKKTSQQLPKDLTMKMILRGKLPWGSGLFIGLYIRLLCSWMISLSIKCRNNKNIPAVLFIHPWQLYRTKEIKALSFKLKVLYCNPLCLPYTANISGCIEGLLRNYEFTSFREYYGY